MVRTVVAFDSENNRIKISEMLERGGVTVRSRCRTGLEVLRAVKGMGGGVVVCGARLPDMTVDELAFELHDSADFLVVSKPAQLELCENQEIFKLPTPVSSGELVGAVHMLIQLDGQRARTQLPRRSPEEEALILRAKQLLMEVDHMTEDQAHRFLQQRSMASSMKLVETARLIVAACDGEVDA